MSYIHAESVAVKAVLDFESRGYLVLFAAVQVFLRAVLQAT